MAASSFGKVVSTPSLLIVLRKSPLRSLDIVVKPEALLFKCLGLTFAPKPSPCPLPKGEGFFQQTGKV